MHHKTQKMPCGQGVREAHYHLVLRIVLSSGGATHYSTQCIRIMHCLLAELYDKNMYVATFLLILS